jgi:hypothetical protein
LERHNQKSKGFTRSENDWDIVYSEIFLSKDDHGSMPKPVER